MVCFVDTTLYHQDIPWHHHLSQGITYPETIELYGKQESVKISKIHSNNCQFGQTITKLESYGETKQALKPYVKETRAALGGLKLVKLTQSEYDSLTTKDSQTLYIIVN